MTEPMIDPMLTTEATEAPKRGRPRKNLNGLSPDIGYSESSTGASPKQAPRLEQRIKEIEIGLLALFKGAGTLIGYWDAFDGGIISGDNPMSTMPLFVDAVCRAARTDAKLRGWLLTVVHVSAYSDIAMFGAMMLLPILMHHNIIPATFFGGMDSSVSSDDNAGRMA